MLSIRNFFIFAFIIALPSFCSAAAPAGGNPLEAFVSEWITAKPVFADLEGTVYVVEFWATWCAPCVQNVPHLKSLAKEYEDKNVSFIGLSQDQHSQKVRDFVKKMEIQYYIGMDQGLADRIGIQGIPSALVINHEGKVVWMGHPGDREFETALAKAVTASPTPILAGVNLGKFSSLRLPLCGGKNFAKAYSQLLGKDQSDTEKELATKIQAAIKSRIDEMATNARALITTDKTKAIAAFKSILDRFSGTELTKPIEKEYDQLVAAQSQPDKKPEVAAVIKGPEQK